MVHDGDGAVRCGVVIFSVVWMGVVQCVRCRDRWVDI